MDELLQALGLEYEQLNLDERNTLNEWLSALQTKQLTVSDIRSYINKMKDEIARKLAEVPDDEKHKTENILLKARLQNYILLYAFVSSPFEAKQELENYIANVKQMRGR